MAWSKKVMTYPPQIRELFIALMEKGQETSIAFTTEREALHFERMIQGIRYAFMHDKDASPEYHNLAPLYTAELSEDRLTVRLCGTDQTRRGQLAQRALEQQAAQFKAAGVDFEFHHVQPETSK